MSDLAGLFEARYDVFQDERPYVLLYFVRESRGPVKIGVCGEGGLRMRVVGLQVGNPRDLKVVCAFFIPRGVEGLVHSCLTRARVRGEWFKYAEAMEAAAVCRGWFDEADLTGAGIPLAGRAA